MTDPPPVDPERVDGWRQSESAVETVFDLGPVRVTAATTVYEDDRLRERVRAATGADHIWRFFVAGQIDVPGPSGSRALARLVTDRAADGFADRLAERGFEAVRAVERRRLAVADAAARAVRYEATCRAAGFGLDVEGWLAVWPAADGFRLAGGAYPTGVREAPPDAVAEPLADLLDPARFREELFGLIRAVD